MAKHTSLPQVVLDNAPTQALPHLPTELPAVPTTPTPPTTPPDVILPEDAHHMSLTGVSNLPDWVGF